MKRSFTSILALGFIAAAHLSYAAPAFAQDIATEQTIRSELNDRVSAFKSAMMSRDLRTVIELSLPDKLIANVLQQTGVKMELPAFKEYMIGQMEGMMGSVEIEDFDMDMSRAQFGTSQGLDYALIPTWTKMKVGEQKISATSHTVALYDGGQWYLLRATNDQERNLLFSAFPELETIAIPEGTMKVGE